MFSILNKEESQESPIKQEIVIKPELSSPAPSSESNTTPRPISASSAHKRSRENSEDDATPTKVAKTGTFQCAYCPHVYDKKVKQNSP